MRALLSLFFFGLLSLVVANDFPVWGAEMCKDKEAESHPVLTYNDLKKLFGDEDSLVFEAGVSQNLGRDVPSTKDLTAMFNSLKDEEVPEYIRDRDFVSEQNRTANYSYSNGNVGSVKSMTYGLFESTDTTGTYDTLVFYYIQGNIGGFNYTAGSSFFANVDYSKEDNSLTWLGSQKGVFLLHMPNGTYLPHGTYTGCAQGNAEITCRAVLSSIDSMGIMNTTNYSSKTVTNFNNKYGPENFTGHFDMFSLTGGSNATSSYYGSMPEEGNVFHTTSNGTVTNSESQATLNTEASDNSFVDKSDPFGKANLQGMFNIVFASVGIHLP